MCPWLQAVDRVTRCAFNSSDRPEKDPQCPTPGLSLADEGTPIINGLWIFYPSLRAAAHATLRPAARRAARINPRSWRCLRKVDQRNWFGLVSAKSAAAFRAEPVRALPAKSRQKSRNGRCAECSYGPGSAEEPGCRACHWASFEWSSGWRRAAIGLHSGASLIGPSRLGV